MPKAGLDPVRITSASTSDVPSIRGFILSAWKEAGPNAWGWTGATEESVQELASREHLSRLITNPNVEVFLAREGQQIVGFAADRKESETTIELSGIIVSERVTGKGIGNALMHAAIRAASAAGFAGIIVKTESFNQRAIGFYEANGFRRSGSMREVVEGRNVDLIMLRRTLQIESTQS